MFVGWLALLGCPDSDGTPSDDDDPPGSTGDTAAGPRPACAIAENNALRVICELERDDTGPVEVRWTPHGTGETLVVPGNADVRDVRIVLLDLLGGETYDWELDDRGSVVESGTITVVPLAQELAPNLQLLTNNGPSSLDRLLFSLGCGLGAMLFAVDADGQVRWYQPVEQGGFVSGFDYTDRGSIVAVLARSRVLELELDGLVTKDASVALGTLERVVHHTVIGRQGRVLALDTEAVRYPDGRDYLVDGVTEVSAAGGVNVWDLGDVVDPQGLPPVRDQLYWAGAFPGAEDFAHENSIDVLADGDWLISLKHLDAILRIDATGTVDWVVTGMATPAEFAGPRLNLVSSAGIDPSFQHQHHANLSPWGTLLVVDNGENIEQPTRILELVIDEQAGTADVIRSWELGVACPVQSSAYGMPDGTIVATCARTREVFELDDTGIRRRTALSCPGGSIPASFVRAQPIPAVKSLVR